MADEGEPNLYDVPLMALRPPTRHIIVNELNKKKVLASEEGLPRDYRGLAHLTGLSAPSGDNPANHLLLLWEREPSSSLGQLEDFLRQLDRWDIADDVYQLLREDAKDFSTKMEEKTVGETEKINSEIDSRALTYDDIDLLERGQELQMYDALLLYADQDEDFAQQMLDRLKNDFGLKLCLKDDLVGGLSFEYQGIMRLIRERCNRVIVIFSSSFINSPWNRFFVSFAQALAIDQCRRIIIPCLYGVGRLELPMEVNYLVKLDYKHSHLKNYDFWGRLRGAVTYSPNHLAIRQAPMKATICDITTSVMERPLIPAKCPVLKPIEPAEQNVATKLPAAVEKESKCFKSSSINDLLSAMEDSSTALLSLPAQKFSCSSMNLSEKKYKSKSPTKFFRKLFRSDKEVKKSKKTAVRL